MNRVSVEHLTVLGGPQEVVRDVTVAFRPGRWTAIVGPNGAGKTSLVESMVALRRVASGSVSVAGRNVHSLRERERARLVAFIPQNPVVPVGMSVVDYVGLGRTAHHGILQAMAMADTRAVEEVMKRLNLTNLAQRDVATLSGGECQRAVIARALAQATQILVLDEPTTGLDVRHQFEIMQLLRREVDECEVTVISTLHDLSLAGQYADEMVVIHDARVVLHGPTSEVLRSPELGDCYDMDLRVVEVDGRDVVVPIQRV
jgi:iron complex transport system ATP-binding protein